METKYIIKKCFISKYDKTINKPPYKTMQIDEIDVYEPQGLNDLGVEFAERLRCACRSKGYIFQFYTMCNKKKIMITN